MPQTCKSIVCAINSRPRTLRARRTNTPEPSWRRIWTIVTTTKWTLSVRTECPSTSPNPVGRRYTNNSICIMYVTAFGPIHHCRSSTRISFSVNNRNMGSNNIYNAETFQLSPSDKSLLHFLPSSITLSRRYREYLYTAETTSRTCHTKTEEAAIIF